MMRKHKLDREGKCRDKRPYQALLWAYSPIVRGWEPISSRRFRSREAAWRQCVRWMEARIVQVTRYQWTPDKLPFADIRDIRDNTMIETFGPRVEIVPSAAEVGYW